jgi:hypothetical protein
MRRRDGVNLPQNQDYNKDLNDFLLGFEYGRISEDGIWYYLSLVNKRRRGAAGEEAERVAKEINSMIFDRVPEIRQAILKPG